MFLKISYFSIFGIISNLDRYSTSGEQCLSVKGKTFVRIHDQINCGKNKSIYVEQVWIDRQPDCVYDKSQTNSFLKDKKKISCSSSSYCQVKYYKSDKYRGDRYLNIRFQCKDCIAIHGYNKERITCPATSVIRISDVRIDDRKCPAIRPLIHNTVDADDFCKDMHTCLLNNPYKRTASVYFQCGDGNNIKDHDITTKSYGDNYNSANDITTESYGRSSKIPGEEIYTESNGGPNYAAIAGVLLIICIFVIVLLLRRRNYTVSGKEQIMTNLNPIHDPNHGQTEPENNQQAHSMNLPDTIHISTSHAVDVDNATNEVSNTYSHLRSTVDDSDVMYDHTIRHNVHDTCDGDYGIAHRRITEVDYDVSGNFRQSLSKEADPVYN